MPILAEAVNEVYVKVSSKIMLKAVIFLREKAKNLEELKMRARQDEIFYLQINIT